MRQDLHKEMEVRGLRCKCIRCMEVRTKTYNIQNARLVVRYIEGELENHNVDDNKENVNINKLYKFSKS